MLDEIVRKEIMAIHDDHGELALEFEQISRELNEFLVEELKAGIYANAALDLERQSAQEEL